MMVADRLQATAQRTRPPTGGLVRLRHSAFGKAVEDSPQFPACRLNRRVFSPPLALNPDELVWSYAKRTGVARRPLKIGENLQARVHEQLQNIGNNATLVRSFFGHPSVAYICDL